MSPIRSFCFLFGLLTLATAAAAQSNSPVAVAPRSPVRATGTNFSAVMVGGQSPVAFFRKLLEATPNERTQLLASRPIPARNRIQEKVKEYEALDPEERELRLEATELRWYLVPLMRKTPTARTNELARVPENLLPLVKSRLMLWDIQPPPLQREFLMYDGTLRYFAQTTRATTTNARAEKLAEQFRVFFEIKPEEKQRVLNILSESERAQMEKTLKAFDHLPAAQRAICERNYAKFAGMSEAERADFLKNAESWSQLSPEERQSWRDLVARVPIMPPMPPMPIMPPGLLPNGVKGPVITN
jgi:hypothetical protein